jgi:hypothetical protein
MDLDGQLIPHDDAFISFRHAGLDHEVYYQAALGKEDQHVGHIYEVKSTPAEERFKSFIAGGGEGPSAATPEDAARALCDQYLQ